MDLAHILVIEDDDIVARTIERSLRGEEFRVTLTNSGVEGLKAARRRPPDLVILDIIMPGMDGYTVCREMRADPILADVPILFLTAKAKSDHLCSSERPVDDSDDSVGCSSSSPAAEFSTTSGGSVSGAWE